MFETPAFVFVKKNLSEKNLSSDYHANVSCDGELLVLAFVNSSSL